jgi:hypothetical protein
MHAAMLHLELSQVTTHHKPLMSRMSPLHPRQQKPRSAHTAKQPLAVFTRMVAALLLVAGQGRASGSATEVARGADIGSTVELWVSPTGSDSSAGTSPSAPFLTVQRAAVAIAALTRPLQLGGVKVYVAPGVYELNGTLELGPEHSGSSTEAPVVFVADTTGAGDTVPILRDILACHSHHRIQTHLLLCCMPTLREQATLCHPFQPCMRIPCCVRCSANSTKPVLLCPSR